MPFAFKFGASGTTAIFGGSTTPFETESATFVADAITLVRRSSLEVFPDAGVFEVDPSVLTMFDAAAPGVGEIYDPRLHENEFKWTFNDEYTFTAPTQVRTSMKNANFAYGPQVQHTFRSAGTYTVRLDIHGYISGTLSHYYSTYSFVVGDQDDAFPTTDTLFVSPSSSFSNKPTGAGEYTTITAAINAIKGTDTTAKRIVLNRGESYTHPGLKIGDTTANRFPTCYIVAGGDAGAAPEVTTTSGGFDWDDSQTTGTGTDKDLIIQGINWNGGRDSTTLAGGAETPNFVTLRQNTPNLILLDQCTTKGFAHAIFTWPAPTNIQHSVFGLNDSTVTDFVYWGVAAANFRCCFGTGSAYRSHIDALVDSTPNGGASWRNGGNAELVIATSCDFFCRQGWFGASSLNDYQSALRLNTEGYEGHKANIQSCSFEGGFVPLSLGTASGSTSKAGNVVIQKNYILGNWNSINLISGAVGGFTASANVMIFPNTPNLTGLERDPAAFVEWVDVRGTDATNQGSPMRVFSNTMINEVTEANHGEPSGSGAADVGGVFFTNVTKENNLMHQPDVQTPTTTYAPLATTTFMTPREKGYHHSTYDSGNLQTQLATPSGAADTFIPLTTSTAIGGYTTGLISIRDFDGNVRADVVAALSSRTAKSLGAHETSLES